MLEIKPIEKDVVESLLKLIGDAEIIDGTPIKPDEVTSVAIQQRTVVMLKEEYPWGKVVYGTTAPWDFFVKRLKTLEH